MKANTEIEKYISKIDELRSDIHNLKQLLEDKNYEISILEEEATVSRRWKLIAETLADKLLNQE